MSRVAKKDNTRWRRAGGLTPRRGAQRSREEKAAEAIIDAIATGKKYVEIGSELYVPCGGKFVEWGMADATKIGR